ncbi:MAG TPA: hypothetical protein VMT23_00365 [Candidatus Binatia bacterium]|nr:hypothetical protein [Candidatus Binatia bacterium]
MEAPDFSDEAIEQLIADMREDARTEGDADAEPVPVPDELRQRIITKGIPLTGMMAAAEARAAKVEINGWEPSPGSDAAHYYHTPEELREYLFGDQAA